MSMHRGLDTAGGQTLPFAVEGYELGTAQSDDVTILALSVSETSD